MALWDKKPTTSANGWSTDAVESKWDANSKVDQLTSGREGKRDAGAGSSLADATVVGINANEIPNVYKEIEVYCEAIELQIKKIDEKAKSEQGFKGKGVSTALTNYITSVKYYCKNLVSQLKAFNDKLRNVEIKWEKQVEASKQAIENTSGDNFAAGSEYKYDSTVAGEYVGGAQGTITSEAEAKVKQYEANHPTAGNGTGAKK